MCQVLHFKHRVKVNTASTAFYKHFNKVNHSYSTRFSEKRFAENNIVLTHAKFAVSLRGPKLWNNFLNIKQRVIEHEVSF